MIYLINNIRQHERHFWNCMYSIATQEQIKKFHMDIKLQYLILYIK